MNLFSEEVEQELLEVGTTHQLEQLSRFLEGRPVLVVLGQSCEARAQFVNALLETNLLPSSGGNWRSIEQVVLVILYFLMVYLCVFSEKQFFLQVGANIIWPGRSCCTDSRAGV